ncbi:hypothetical protein [Liquorilactobacillus satsumensis]|uniref:hypothetical protein n=1 Tax=Liquorilactobacillus TaxID=2767888 RepID=UPI0021C332B2|nr:hypothetical protein [Liquorilactobacillus satsumensis]MCP9329101.1 hypothetical protein [Liquorilactobacillus satsumensis]
MTVLDEILNSPDIPIGTKLKVESLDKLGKEALNAYYDENSDFYRHARTEALIKKFYANPEEITYLYHYTSYETLKKIVSGQKFFLGSIHHMNDVQEMTYTLQLLEKEFMQLDAPQPLLNELKAMKNKLPWDVYIWCFSENDHSQSLSNYGEIALGLKNQNVMNTLATHFSEGAETLADFSPGNAYVFPLKVEYNLQTQTEYIKPIAKVWVSAYKNLCKDPEDMKSLILDCVQAVYLCSLCFKSRYLRQEEEIRYLVIKINENHDLNPDFYLNHKPFVSCELKPAILDKVILSKKIATKLDEIRDFLHDNKFDSTKIESTKLPY